MWIRRSVLGFIVGAVAFSVDPVSASIQFLPGATNFRIDTITGLDIGGVIYDAKFEHGISYNDFLGLHPLEPSFPLDADAAAALQSVKQAILDEVITVPLLSDHTLLFVVPQYVDTSSFVYGTFAALAGFDPLTYVTSQPPGSLIESAARSIAAPAAWVAFTRVGGPAVPEPASLIVWAGIAMVTGLVLQRRAKFDWMNLAQRFANHS